MAGQMPYNCDASNDHNQNLLTIWRDRSKRIDDRCLRKKIIGNIYLDYCFSRESAFPR